MTKTAGKRVYEILERADEGDAASAVFDWCIILLIITNIAAVILESFQGLSVRHHRFFHLFEVFSVAVFTIEYLLRLMTSRYKYPGESTVRSVVRYVFSGMAVIDLLAILPFYLPMLITADLRFLRVLRLTRLLRILKIQRYSDSFTLIASVFRKKKEDLILTLSVMFMLLLLASSLMYYIETEVQPDQFPNIIAAFWWGVATLTTIGYGDVYPVTVLGKLLSAVIAVLGIGIIALPTGIISSGFIEEIEQKRKQREDEQELTFCPHCGRKLPHQN